MKSKSGKILSNSAEDRAEWAFGRSSGQDEKVLRADSVFTMAQANCHPALLALKEADGIRVKDHAGRTYIDLHGNNCHHIGYQHPRLKAALIDQLKTITCNNRGFTNAVFTLFAEKLSSLWPGYDGRVFMLPGGAAANELGLQIARVHTGRYKSITFSDSYHGRSFGAISLTGAKVHRSARLGPLLEGCFYVPSFRPSIEYPHPDSAARASVAAIKDAMEKEGDFACLLAEPVANDCYRPPDWYWPQIRDLCDQHGTLLTMDEVSTGLGKMGAIFNTELFNIRPDMTVLGKALGGAVVPAAAIVADGKLDSAPELNLGYYTHEKSPFMARAALETLNIIVEEGLVEKAREYGGYAHEQLEDLRTGHTSLIPNPVRQHGLMLSLDIEQADNNKEINTNLASSIFYRCMDEGVILNYPARGNNLTFSFPLVSERSDIDQVCKVFAWSLRSIVPEVRMKRKQILAHSGTTS